MTATIYQFPHKGERERRLADRIGFTPTKSRPAQEWAIRAAVGMFSRRMGLSETDTYLSIQHALIVFEYGGSCAGSIAEGKLYARGIANGSYPMGEM